MILFLCMDLSLCRYCVSCPADSAPHSLSPVVARDGSQCVLGLSRSVPSSPGERERSPSDKFSPEGRRPAAPTSSSTSPPAEQGAKVRTRMIPSAYGLYTYYHITGVQQCFFALSVPIRADLALIIVKVRQAFCCETE